MEAMRRFARTQFQFAVAIGVVVNFITTYMQTSPISSVGIPIAIMAYYWWRVQGLVKATPLDETFADSCYYLGFIFTLSSLSATLILLLGPTAAAQSSQLLLANLGTALTTTLFGLGIRAMRRTYVEQHGAVEDAEVSLTSATDQFTHEVRSLVTSVIAVRRDLERTISETLEGIDVATRTLNDSLIEMRSQVNQRAQLQQEAFEKTLEVLKRRNTSIDRQVERLDDAVKRFADTAQATDGVTKANVEATQALKAVYLEHQRQAQIARDVARLMVEQVTQIKKGIEALKGIEAASEGATKSAEKVVARGDAGMKVLEERISRATADAQKAVEQSNAAVQKLVNALVDGANAISGELEGK